MKPTAIKTEITGTVCGIVATAGQHVEEGDTIVLIESMKMEIPVQAPCAGTIQEILPNEGELVNEEDTVALIVPS